VSAGCYSCGPSVVYQAPVVTYTAPVVYSHSYAVPYASAGCGCAAQAPMYVVNQGPAFNAPVVGEAEPIPVYEPGYRRAYPYFGGGHMRWHHRRWHRGYGYRGHGPRFGFRGYHRYGAVVPGARYSMRHPMMAGPHGMHRGGMHRMHAPHLMVGPGGVHRRSKHAGPRPGSVHPMPLPKAKPMP
jgi:hypothetical protein